MQKIVLILAFIGSIIAIEAEAGPFRRSRSYSNNSYTSNGNIVGGSNSTAQGVAEMQARSGVCRHFGGNSGYEGCGMGSTPEAALNNCCYSRSGMAVVDQGVAQGSNGMWYACKRYR